ncbi:MAG: hypothetical protein GXY83_02575 [Rhodopirellula sp.]|nr:hypothetical protein [Rhodopirellula sp.]
MDSLTASEVKRLSKVAGLESVSIFLPTHRTGTEMQQDPIRLRNLLREAERQLVEAGSRAPAAKAILEPAYSLLADGLFWQHQSDGLAVFAAGDQFYRYRVPLRFDELVIVAKRFQLKPLFPFLTGDGHFFILALSQNEVRMLEATRHSIDEIEIEQLPTNLRETLGQDEQERQLQFHTRSGERGGERAAMFHGHGPGQEYTKEQLEKFFRQIDVAVCDYLRDERAPLVLAGVDYYFSIYRSVSRYVQLAPEGVAGSPDRSRPEELHARAWPLVEPMFRQARETALARFRQLAGTGRTATNVAEILPSVSQGRVEVLFVATDRRQWGTFDDQSQELLLHETSHGRNEDLLDRAAVDAYLTGGVVYAMKSGELPDGVPLAAVYRY